MFSLLSIDFINEALVCLALNCPDQLNKLCLIEFPERSIVLITKLFVTLFKRLD